MKNWLSNLLRPSRNRAAGNPVPPVQSILPDQPDGLLGLQKETQALAQRIAEHPPTGVRFAKYNLRHGLKVDFEAALEMLAASQALAMTTPEHKKALAAWRNRKPAAREDS